MITDDDNIPSVGIDRSERQFPRPDAKILHTRVAVRRDVERDSGQSRRLAVMPSQIGAARHVPEDEAEDGVRA